ncbi:DUF1569 domain-containing protein [uncultured Dokdonia sp.]|uniref:DUF1569 domain-containing protein n=1 Tax=uncultured Dokdonia sp. TaxID=575653 RepID=UPI0026385D12|nr:DUF1569 domain-containing protein [uncultured Dokdonia sp.]
MKSLFDPTTYKETKTRIQALQPDSAASWGKMNVGQMVTHCQFPFKVALSDKPIKAKWNPIMRLFKKSLYNDKPWRKNLPTAPEAKITDNRDLDFEREKLLSMVDAFYNKRDQQEWQPHPMFGHFTHEQWGQLEYKHLDYHLGQFGV